ncbi:hypothetical protein MINS_03920 [Mycolicibacterium insubricum]|uniref:hypothetical protein n=1 Tax=Mycolicibacterium insubricum TaxID=444597 RepID=UPI00138C39AD|nr:hypothetical protein [Mycolicibacterium insubricum]MCV7082889.1 hypothetical protein [Mycolicibacterium insubricum]BBZ64963.1 hypothetical protein MINS_03920 [Mycolicibacterium insubricum]
MTNIDDEITRAFFLESGSEPLRRIYQWARARYAAPWAVLGAVLLRIAASVGPHVQLPGLIGGPASLNLLCAFASPSGGGKGISDKVAREAWPTPVTELPIGSGEGIAAAFKQPDKPDADHETLLAAVFAAPEIDTLTGLASRQGSILLAQLKSMAMGEQIGQHNAQKATSRVIEAHSYRACLSVGAQPGHCGIIFGDTTGGTPQRFLWFPTTDPNMPADPGPEPEPLDSRLPGWARPAPIADRVPQIIGYGPDTIRQTVITAHLARQRGEAEALDGHALLTRCKVAALLAIMHHRSVVDELDWELSGTVMEVSDQTRQWLLNHAQQAERAKNRARAIRQAEFNDMVDSRLLDGVKNSIIRTLARDGEQAGNVLRSRMGKRERRDLFDQAVALLESEGRVSSIAVDRGARYRLTRVQGEPPVQGPSVQVGYPEPKVQGEPSATVTELDSRRPDCPECHRYPARPETGKCDACTVATIGAHEFLVCWMRHNAEPGQWVTPSVVIAAGTAIGYKHSTLKAAQQRVDNPRIESSGTGRGSRWRIAPANDQETA